MPENWLKILNQQKSAWVKNFYLFVLNKFHQTSNFLEMAFQPKIYSLFSPIRTILKGGIKIAGAEISCRLCVSSALYTYHGTL